MTPSMSAISSATAVQFCARWSPGSPFAKVPSSAGVCLGPVGKRQVRLSDSPSGWHEAQEQRSRSDQRPSAVTKNFCPSPSTSASPVGGNSKRADCAWPDDWSTVTRRPLGSSTKTSDPCTKRPVGTPSSGPSPAASMPGGTIEP